MCVSIPWLVNVGPSAEGIMLGVTVRNPSPRVEKCERWIGSWHAFRALHLRLQENDVHGVKEHPIISDMLLAYPNHSQQTSLFYAHPRRGMC